MSVQAKNRGQRTLTEAAGPGPTGANEPWQRPQAQAQAQAQVAFGSKLLPNDGYGRFHRWKPS